MKKHFDRVIQCISLLLLCALTAALIAAFKGDLLPFSADGDAFETIYAIGDSEAE